MKVSIMGLTVILMAAELIIETNSMNAKTKGRVIREAAMGSVGIEVEYIVSADGVESIKYREYRMSGIYREN